MTVGAAQSAAPATLGGLLQELVNRISHRGGETLSIMNEAAVTLHQVLLLSRLAQAGQSMPSKLATDLGMSLPSISQMLERLVQLGLVRRAEDAADRRRRPIAVTPAALTLLGRLSRARSAEYERGLDRLPAHVRREFADVVRRILDELERAS